MKKVKSILIVFILMSASVIDNQAYAELKTNNVPMPPHVQKDKYSTDLFTGSANYSFPIKVAEGTSGLTPEMSISYNSSGSKSPYQRVGLGWQLTENYVERNVNYTPLNTNDDKYRLHFQGTTHELVYIASEDRYHTKIESNLYIKLFTSGGQNEKGSYWLIKTPDGTSYRMGYTNNSELMCNHRDYINRWNLDEVTDINNNHIYYTYFDDNGLSYLQSIKYNNDQLREVLFSYDFISHEHWYFDQGCKLIEKYRLNNIKVKANNNLIHQYDMTYTLNPATESLLTSIVEKGSDGTSALPAASFEYKPQIKNFNTQIDKWFDHVNLDNLQLNRNDVTVADVNGDSLPDIVRSYLDNGYQTTWKVLLNQGTSWSSSYQTWVNAAYLQGAYLPRQFTRLIDMNGDGLPDIVSAEGCVWYVYLNTGTSWSTTSTTWGNLCSISSEVNLNTARVDLVDVTGDNLPDVVRSWDGTQYYEVVRNLGNGFHSWYEVWSHNVMDVGLDNPDVRIIDVNGDNLADLVRTTFTGNDQSSTDTWKVYKNTGSAWSTSPELWVNNAPISAHLSATNTTMGDVNGDGLVDIIKIAESGTTDPWHVFLNLGNSWSTTSDVWISGFDIDLGGETNVRVVDVTGDGMVDILRTDIESGGSTTWNVWKNNGSTPNLLSKITNSQGGSISYDYTYSGKYDNTGADDQSDLPFPLWVVEKMTINNGMTNLQNTNDITTYSYEGGLYHTGLKELQGFSVVNTIEPNGSKKKYVFHQYETLTGKIHEIQSRDSQNNPYFEYQPTWAYSTTNGVTTANMTEEKNITYDGTAVDPKTVQTNYQYDAYGNVTKKSELGDTSVSGDERYTYNDYTYNTTDWIVDNVKHTYKNAANDLTKVEESWNYYDGHTNINDAPTKGNLTMTTKWLDGGSSNPSSTYGYDTFGNQTTVIDANSHTTSTTYDTTGTYPTSTTNAKNQTQNISYDLGTGNILSKTDLNGNATTYTYDVFGRVTKEIQPYDTSDYPTVSYQYYFDGTAPEGTVVSKRETSGSANTLSIATYIDGFGRKIQTRSDAEDSAKQIVTDTFYDPSGEVLKESVPHLDTLSTTYAAPVANTKVTELTYDPLNRVTISKNPKGDIKTIAYDHFKETTVDENGHIKRVFKNAYDKKIKVEEVNGTNTYTTNYTYNARDELTRITDHANNNFDFEYDTLGRKTKQIDPDLGTWEFTYDPAGNVLTEKDNKNITTTKTYDELDRLLTVNYPNDTDVTYTYDGNNKKGTVTSVVDAAGTVSYTYDNRLRKTQEQRTINGTSMTTQFAYDSADRVTSRTNPDNTVITYTFNNQGEIETVSNAVSDIDYNAQGKITKKEFANNVTTNYTYNADDFRLNRIQTGTLFDSNYTYDAVGNIKKITDNLTTKDQLYGYDDLDRLTTASESAGFTYQYEYNPIGNLTKFVSADETIDYTYGQNAGAHALTSSTEQAQSTNNGTELLSSAWNLVGNNGDDQAGQGIASNALAGATEIQITFNLHGTSFGGGDDEASLFFVQNGDWRAANLTLFGAQNGYNGSQTITIPISSFHKVGDANVVLNPNQAVTDVGARFWNSGAFTVDITSIKVLGGSSVTPTNNPTPTATPTPGSNGTPYGGTARAIPGTIQLEDYNVGGENVAYHDADSSNNGGAYRTTEGVDIGQDGALYGIGWTQEGEWLKYTVDVASTGTYTFNLRVASPNNNSKVHAEIDGVDVTGPITINSTGGWDNWTTLSKSGINLTAGQHILRLVMDQRSNEEIWIANMDWMSFTSSGPTSTPTPTPTPSSGWTEILGTTFNLVGNNGDAQDGIQLASNTLNGKTQVQVTFNLHGTSFGGGDDEASIIFIQNNEWRAANVTLFGAQNGYNGSQTITIPISSFHKVGDANVVLNPNQAVSDLGARFWNSGAFTVDITSVKVQ